MGKIESYSEQHRDQVEADLALKELCYREIGGTAIALYWHRRSNSVSVSIRESQPLRTLIVPVDNSEAMDAYNHPYVYAEREGLLLYTSEDD